MGAEGGGNFLTDLVDAVTVESEAGSQHTMESSFDGVLILLRLLADLVHDPAAREHLKAYKGLKRLYRALIKMLCHDSVAAIVHSLSILACMSKTDAKVASKLFSPENVNQTIELIMNLVIDSATGREEERLRALHLISDVATEGAMLEALEQYGPLEAALRSLLPLCHPNPPTVATLAVFRLFRLLAESSSFLSRTISVVILNVDHHRGTNQVQAAAALDAIIELAGEAEEETKTTPAATAAGDMAARGRDGRGLVSRSRLHREASGLLTALGAHEESQFAVASSAAVKGLLTRTLFRNEGRGRKVLEHLMGLGPRLQWAISEAVRAHPAQIGELVSRVMMEGKQPSAGGASEEEAVLPPEDPEGETSSALLALELMLGRPETESYRRCVEVLEHTGASGSIWRLLARTMRSSSQESNVQRALRLVRLCPASFCPVDAVAATIVSIPVVRAPCGGGGGDRIGGSSEAFGRGGRRPEQGREEESKVEALTVELDATYRKLLVVSRAYQSTQESFSRERAECERLEACQVRMKAQVEGVVNHMQDELAQATRKLAARGPADPVVSSPGLISLGGPRGRVDMDELLSMKPGMIQDANLEIRRLHQERAAERGDDGLYSQFSDGSSNQEVSPTLPTSFGSLDRVLSEMQQDMERERARKQSPMRGRGPNPAVDSRRSPGRRAHTKPG